MAEEACTGSGIKETVGWTLQKYAPHCRVHGVDLGNDFGPHGAVPLLYERAGLDPKSLANFAREVVTHEE